MGPYKTISAAFNALKKGFKKQTKRDPNPIEEEMIMEEAKTKITSQGENISTLDTGIMSQAPGTTGMSKFVDESGEFTEKSKDIFKKGLEGLENRNKTKAVDRPFVTGEEMSAFTLEENARKLNKAKGMIDNLGAKTTKQKLFVADLVEDVGEGIFDNVDMGAVVRSNMFDDLIEQGVDDDLLTKIMYSGTKSDDFGITMAKIKGNAMDEGVDISETVDFYERTFNEVSRPKKADGGRIGYSIGSLPKGIQALVGLINKKFGKGAVKTADEMDRPKNVKEFEDFETRNPNPKRQLTDDEIKFYEEELGDSETWMNDGTVGEAEKALKDRREYIADMELEYKKGNLNPGPGEKGRKEFLESKLEEMEMSGDKRLMSTDEIEELSNMDLESEMNVAKGLAPKMVERLQLKERFPGLDDELVERILIDDNPQRKAEVIATIEESYKMSEKGMQPEDIISTFKNTSRSKNASGGLPHILGV